MSDDPASVISEVASQWGVPVDTVLGRGMRRDLTPIRVAMVRKLYDEHFCTFDAIAAAMQRSRSTVIRLYGLDTSPK